jgi:hypothetical protein
LRIFVPEPEPEPELDEDVGFALAVGWALVVPFMPVAVGTWKLEETERPFSAAQDCGD